MAAEWIRDNFDENRIIDCFVEFHPDIDKMIECIRNEKHRLVEEGLRQGVPNIENALEDFFKKYRRKPLELSQGNRNILVNSRRNIRGLNDRFRRLRRADAAPMAPLPPSNFRPPPAGVGAPIVPPPQVGAPMVHFLSSLPTSNYRWLRSGGRDGVPFFSSLPPSNWRDGSDVGAPMVPLPPSNFRPPPAGVGASNFRPPPAGVGASYFSPPPAGVGASYFSSPPAGVGAPMAPLPPSNFPPPPAGDPPSADPLVERFRTLRNASGGRRTRRRRAHKRR